MKFALLWCGQADISRTDDFNASKNDLDEAVQAAVALGVPRANVHAFIGHDWLRIEGVKIHPASVEAFQRVVALIAGKMSGESDAVLFVATNHGKPEGLFLMEEEIDTFAEDPAPRPRFLTPELVEGALDSIKAQQILLIGTCHAGGFLPIGRQGRAVYSVCKAEETIQHEKEPPHTAFLKRMLRAWIDSDVVSAWSAVEKVPQHRKGGLQVFPQGAGSAVWPK